MSERGRERETRRERERKNERGKEGDLNVYSRVGKRLVRAAEWLRERKKNERK